MMSKPLQACQMERGVIATLWLNVDQLLASGSGVVDKAVSLLANSLPTVEQLETQQLPVLAQLHVSSATNLMATARILAPSAFPEGASSPYEHMLSQLDEPLLEVVCSLIDLQLFHLQRAALLSATSRRRSAGHPRCPAATAASAVSDTLAAHGDDL